MSEDHRPGMTMPLRDLYGNLVGEVTIDKDGRLTGSIDPDSFWNSITRVGHIGLVESVSIMPNPVPQQSPTDNWYNENKNSSDRP